VQRILLVLVVAVGLTGVLLGGAVFFRPELFGTRPDGVPDITIDQSLPAVNQDGEAVTLAAWPGRHRLVFFGFTHCPDVCPLALGEVSIALDALGDDARRVQPLFVTVDPERDTPEALKAFVAAFDPRIAALTGSEEEVAAIARTFRAYYRKVPVEGAMGYTMDHSAFLYLLAPDGRLLRFFSHDTSGDRMAATIRAALGRG